ncbi:hypothetical protein CQA57_05760 [Helicobacter anseris]|uniref:Uncharacterized protein n=1 Tax=Helicobacter anseris TaxID=375926 RepID=A0A3D8J846_9HELI|nr:hypothetical protein [Helicobacter anseris]RDU73031.1 hypothetical protein CQA57_05760 [Helicobacter anseris]
MRFWLLNSFFFLSIASCIDFLGTFGDTYEILEENGQDYIERKMREKDFQKQMLENAQDQIKKATNPMHLLPLCMKDGEKTIDFEEMIQNEARRRQIDLNDPVNKAKIASIFSVFNIHYLILDVNDNRQVAYARENNFKELIVSNGYVYDSRLEDFVEKSFVLPKHMIKDFSLQCVPTALIFDTKTKKLLIKEIDVSKRK